MRSRVMLCPKKTIETIGFNDIKISGKYDILRIIGKNSDVDLSEYSEIVLLYQYPLKETDSSFLEFVKKNQDCLKGATLLFDIPIEIINETGAEQSKEYMKKICKDVFEDDDIDVSLHASSKKDDALHKFSELIDMDITVNTDWEKESGHTALLTTYHFQEIGQPVMRIYRFEIIIGLILAVIGAIIAILDITDVISADLTILFAVLICFGAIVAITGYNGKLKDNWRK